MAQANTDLTEEDAADLQFPKEEHVMSPDMPLYHNGNLNMCETDNLCVNCSTDLVAPFIFCVKCKVRICVQCFSHGAEFDNHKNDHSYQIMRDDFSIFANTDWTAKEESVLLDSLLRYGNWNLVAKELPNRTVKDIKRHYDYFYLERHGSSQLPETNETETSVFLQPIVPYRFRINDTDDPPRYNPCTVGYKYLAGYNPARADFESEFDKNAEDLLSSLKTIDADDPHYDLLTNLQCSIVQSYNRRLQERQRWKTIIKAHGLIVLRKMIHWLHRYDLTITKPVYEKLIHIMQFCTPDEFEMLMEGLHRSGELTFQISRLCELRQKGITSMGDARLYLKIKPLHEKCENELRTFQQNLQLNWKIKEKGISVEIPSKRKTGFTPIDILGMPGYEKLSPAERDLCKNVRLVPAIYMELKELLIAENKKTGSVRLKTARKMLKIDVNKTRRLYDFLVLEGFIIKPDC